jgi:hypothetical protein
MVRSSVHTALILVHYAGRQPHRLSWKGRRDQMPKTLTMKDFKRTIESCECYILIHATHSVEVGHQEFGHPQKSHQQSGSPFQNSSVINHIAIILHAHHTT